MTLTSIVALTTEIITLLGVVAWVWAKLKSVANGVKCLLRSDMLHIYYKHKEDGKIRQYEFENFVQLYEAYKSMNGNSFVDKIYEEIKTFEIIS